jgi:hypothetical protein
MAHLRLNHDFVAIIGAEQDQPIELMTPHCHLEIDLTK